MKLQLGFGVYKKGKERQLQNAFVEFITLLKNNIEIFRLQYRQYCQDKIWLLDIEKDMYEFEVIRQTTSTKYSLMVFLY